MSNLMKKGFARGTYTIPLIPIKRAVTAETVKRLIG